MPRANELLTLLTRPDCGLCEVFLEQLLEQFPQLAAAVTLADVDSSAGWQGRFGPVIPVLLDDEGTVICQTRFDAESIRTFVGLHPGGQVGPDPHSG